LVACCYEDSPHEPMHLKTAPKDVYTMRNMLLNAGWKEDEIVILVETPETGLGEMKPTRHEIRKQLRHLVDGAQAGDQLFLHMSGHGGQQRTLTDPYEKDGKDEYFIPCDYHRCMKTKHHEKFKKTGELTHRKSKILDNDLVIDCCSAGTMLDLPYDDSTVPVGPFTKLLSFIYRASGYLRVRRRLSQALPLPLFQSVSKPPVLLPRFSVLYSSDNEYIRRPLQDKRKLAGNIISISACHDGKQTFETRDGGSLVTMLAKILSDSQSRTRSLTIRELNCKLKDGLEKAHEEMKERIKQRHEPWDDSLTAPVPQLCFSRQYNWNDKFTLSS